MKTYTDRTQDILERIAMKRLVQRKRIKRAINAGLICVALVVAWGITVAVPWIIGAVEEAQESAIPTLLSNDTYDIKKDGDELYLYFHKDYGGISGSSYGNPSGNVQGAIPALDLTVAFDSLAKMKECIETGNFTRIQLARMQYFPRASNGKIAVCDPDNLYDFKVPEGLLLKQVVWTGVYYSFTFTPDYSAMKYGGYGSIGLISQERYEEIAQKADLKSGENANIKILSESVDPQTNGTVICYENRNGVFKQILYTHTDGENKITIEETYRESDGFEDPSISVWGNCGEQYFSGSISALRERPSYEWITSFVLTPYVETENS